MLDVFSVIQISHILLAALMPQISELVACSSHIMLSLHDDFQDLDLLFLNSQIFSLELVELSDQQISFLSVLADLVEAVTFELLFFKLDLLVLLLQVPELFLQRLIVLLLAPELVDLGSQLTQVVVLVSRQPWHHSLDHHGRVFRWRWQRVPRNVLGVTHLVCNIPALGQGCAHGHR